jgi:hypothetical protein
MARTPRTTTAVVVLTPEQRAAAHALVMRDVALDNTARAADAVRDYVGASASAAALGAKCTGTFLKRLVFGAPKQRVELTVAAASDEQLIAALRRHNLL